MDKSSPAVITCSSRLSVMMVCRVSIICSVVHIPPVGLSDDREASPEFKMLSEIVCDSIMKNPLVESLKEIQII